MGDLDVTRRAKRAVERSESIGVPVGDTPEEVADHVEDLL